MPQPATTPSGASFVLGGGRYSHRKPGREHGDACPLAPPASPVALRAARTGCELLGILECRRQDVRSGRWKCLPKVRTRELYRESFGITTTPPSKGAGRGRQVPARGRGKSSGPPIDEAAPAWSVHAFEHAQKRLAEARNSSTPGISCPPLSADGVSAMRRSP